MSVSIVYSQIAYGVVGSDDKSHILQTSDFNPYVCVESTSVRLNHVMVYSFLHTK